MFNTLECNIDEMMNYLRTTWPSVSITPKLHILEDNVVKFISEWKVGLGLYAEHGGESNHAEFNKLDRIMRQ